jgi:3-hydroxyisobutyrate dehydrogenase
MEGVVETSAVADELGITVDELLVGLEGSPLAAPSAVAKLHKVAAADFQREFALALALKDVDLALDAVATSPPALEAISEHWHFAVNQGLGALDVSAARLALGPPVAGPDVARAS